MKKIIIFLVAITTILACNDSGEKLSQSRLIVHLTDSPANYEEVLIDVQQLLVNITDDDEGWTDLGLERTGQVDLLALANGKEILLVDEDFPAGQISQMRLVLGENNEIIVDGELHELKTPSAQQSGLKFNIHATLIAGVDYEMWLDFDVAKSVVAKGNGQYSLKPTIRVFTNAISGAIKGKVNPLDAKPVVTAISATNETYSTIASDDGEFLIRGLTEGKYRLEFKPTENYKEKEMLDIEVSLENVTDVGIVEFETITN